MALGDKAYKIYSQGQTSGELTAIPRNKYSFTVSIYMKGVPEPLILERIANVQMPSFTYRTQTLNEYNNKAIVQTGIDYTPITLTAYDTKDATFEEFLKNYARHYVAGPMNDDSYVDWINNPKGIELRDSNHYIERMIIDRVDSANLSNEIEIFHPFIANADADTLDYSDSSPTVFRVSFNYEGYRILSSSTALPPQLQKPVETITPPESGQVLPLIELNKSAKFATEEENTTSNKAAIIPVTETTVSTFTGTLQGHSPTKLELAPYLTGTGSLIIDRKRAAIQARLARAKEIVALGVDAGDTKFQPGINQIVTLPNGDRFIAQVPVSEINYTDTNPDELGAI